MGKWAVSKDIGRFPARLLTLFPRNIVRERLGVALGGFPGAGRPEEGAKGAKVAIPRENRRFCVLPEAIRRLLNPVKRSLKGV